MNKEEPLWMKLYRKEVIKPQQRKRETEQQGRTEASRSGFYTTRGWIRIRDKRRRNNPLCQRCEEKGFIKPANVVDHIKPVDDYPELALDYGNTQSLCYRCHSIKTAQDAKAKRQQQKRAAGRRLMKELEQRNTDG